MAYLQNKGFYKGFFYPEYRFRTGFSIIKKVNQRFPRLTSITVNHFLVDNYANEKLHYSF